MKDKISYSIKISKRAKRVRLAVHRDGSVVVTTPLGVRRPIIERFVFDKRDWVWDKIELFKGLGDENKPIYSREDYLKNKDEVLELINERILFYNKIYGFSFNKVFIKNQKTCWGSCSSKKNLNFNYKILFLTQEQQDYIVVHELCHLKELNHSKNFWSLVAKTTPDYLNIKKGLRSYRLV